MTKIYLSHPYGGLERNREKAARLADWYRATWAQEGRTDIEIVNPLEELRPHATANNEDQMLGLAVDLMRTCDAVVFAPGWKHSRGCRYEHMVAHSEGIRQEHIPEEFVA